MTDYVTDPELLNQLNSADESGYVTDPELLNQLNNSNNVNADRNILTAEARPALGVANQLSKGGVRDVATIGNILRNNMNPETMQYAYNALKTAPVESIKKVGQAYLTGHPWGSIPRALAAGIAAPENAVMLPYNMAAYEQAKIRANPTAPEYASNPYAMQVRGQAPTQAAAGAMNQRSAVRDFSTAGNPAIYTAQFQQLKQQQDAQATAVLSQPPTAQNFIARMQALAHKYGNALPNL